MLDRMKGIGELTLKGMVAANAPSIFKGMVNELLHQYHITPEVIIPMVETDQSLWSLVNEKHYEKIKKVAEQVKNIDWLTGDWFIEAIKKEHPALASLFLGWPRGKAKKWLDRQISETKKKLVENNLLPQP